MEDIWRAASRVRKESVAVTKAMSGSISQSDGRVSWARQFWVLWKRAMLAQLRNPTDTAARLLVATWIGLLTGERMKDLED